MLQVGALYVQPFYVYNDAGALADASTQSLVIALPDGTSSGSVALTHTGTGIYIPAYPLTQAGRHNAVFTTTGPVTIITDDFDVQPTETFGLISLAEARQALNLAATNTSNDDELRLYIAAATNVIEDIAGAQVLRTFVETRDGGTLGFPLANQPIYSVTSVTEAGTTLAAGDYSVNMLAGTITRMVGIQPYPFRYGVQNIVITYKAGNPVISAASQLAARELVREWWQQGQQGGRPAFGGGQPAELPPPSYAVMRRVIELLNPDITPGIA